MTKKKFSHIFDKVFWGIIALLPIIVYIIYVVKNGTIYLFDSVFADFGFGIDISNSIVYTTLTDIFGVVADSTANISAFTSNGLILYVSYMVYVELVHLLIDCLLYIPRIAQKFIDKGVD